MSFNTSKYNLFGDYNFAVDTPWNGDVSNDEQPFVPPRGQMVYLSGTTMAYLSGNTMEYLET
jgi:hypothetical protein